MLELSLLFSLFYIFQLLFFAFGWKKAGKGTPNNIPIITVILAAKNEENNLRSCLLSISSLDYPPEKLEVIIANDNSTDRTQEIISEFTEKYKHIRSFIPESEKDNLKGKMNALNQAIDQSIGEIIFITDADCVVPNSWIKETLKYYDKNTGLVCGITHTEYGKIFHGIQSLDWIYHLSLASGSFGLNIPYSCAGNNMSFRRNAYNETGGYKKLGFSITEDVKLLQAIAALAGWKCKFPIDQNTLVLTKAMDTIKQMVHQKTRWASRDRLNTGGKKSPMPLLLLMSLSSLIYPLIFISPFLTGNLFIMLIPLFIKTTADFLFMFIPLNRLGLKNLYKYFPAFELYFIIYVSLLPILIFFNKKLMWKGQIYN